MQKSSLSFTLRIDRKLFQKFIYIVKTEYRSANKDIGRYIAGFGYDSL